jgi:TPP-dependent pyruvate/acetoin dehydrogenase alpha subunit
LFDGLVNRQNGREESPVLFPESSDVPPVLSTERLRTLYREMLRIRLCEERIAELYSEKEMRCPVHLCIGQEAIPVGVSAHLRRADVVFSGHRSHGHYLAKGGDLPRMLAEIYGKATGCAKGKGGSMHLVDVDAGFLGATPIVASSIPIAVGAAFGAKLKNKTIVTVAYFGEGATEEGVFQESLNFAVLHHLPIVFVCENNLYSVYSPVSVRQPETRDIVKIAQAHGCVGGRADGNSVQQVYQVAQQAVERARRGEGPTLLEFPTYRWREHCGPQWDNHLGYRTPAEYEEWKARCPIQALREELQNQRHFSDSVHEKLVADLSLELDGAIAFAKESPFPSPEQLLQHVYSTQAPLSKEQAA